jgi:hypothetical protein
VAAAATGFLQPGEDSRRRDRQYLVTNAGGILDGGGERGHDPGQRAFAGFLGAEGAVGVHALDDVHLDVGRFDDGRHAVVEHVGHHVAAVLVAVSSHMAWPMPIQIAPCTWPSTDIGLMREAAVDGGPDLVHGDDAEVEVDADLDGLRRVGEAHGGADRAAALLAALELGGQVKVPLTVSVPVPTSASSATSAKGTWRSGSLATAAASPYQSTSASLDLEARAAAASRALEVFRRVAAALPTMKVTREEYEPLSLGVTRRIVGDDADAVVIDAEHLGDDLGDDGRRALADVGGAGEDGDAAGVEIELEDDHRVRLAVTSAPAWPSR